MDKVPDAQTPRKYAIYGVIFNILFYPVAIVVFFAEGTYGILANFTNYPDFENMLILILATTILPVIGSYNMKKALNIAKINNSKVGFYNLLFIISVFHIVIILSLIFWLVNVHSSNAGISDLDPGMNPDDSQP